jgi:hypothetical protein
MKIIELPQKVEKKPTIYLIRCENQRCEALIEVEHHELKRFHADFYIMECPNCRAITSIHPLELDQWKKR